MHSNQMIRKAGPGLKMLSLLAATPALAHHPFGMPEGSGGQGVISWSPSGDHLLFLGHALWV